MTPGAIIALVKDVVIVVAVGAVIWLLVSYGKDIVKVQDMAAVQKQIAANAETEARWRQEREDVDKNRDEQLGKVAAAVGQQRAPVYIVRNPPSPSPVPNPPGQARGAACPAAGPDPGPRVDSRPAINAYELKYSTALVDCYAALDKWPKP